LPEQRQSPVAGSQVPRPWHVPAAVHTLHVG